MDGLLKKRKDLNNNNRIISANDRMAGFGFEFNNTASQQRREKNIPFAARLACDTYYESRGDSLAF